MQTKEEIRKIAKQLRDEIDQSEQRVNELTEQLEQEIHIVTTLKNRLRALAYIEFK